MSRHVPVLLEEVVQSLELKSGMNIVDCTLGDAGHSEAILERTAPAGRLLGIDADPESLLRAKQYLYTYGQRVLFVRDNFVRLKDIIAEQSFYPVHGILFDLGWSSPQFSERGRGFSFELDEPLDMRYQTSDVRSRISENSEPTAADILNNQSRAELETIFRQYGEEPLYREIAAAIVEVRRNQPIERTAELVEIILSAYRKKLGSTREVPWIGGLNPSTRVFQALRIAVNRELDVLKSALPQALDALTPGGRLAVISFHSLEDRIVKQFFQKFKDRTLKIITDKPIAASPQEIKANPRARSAKLRVAEKLSS